MKCGLIQIMIKKNLNTNSRLALQNTSRLITSESVLLPVTRAAT